MQCLTAFWMQMNFYTAHRYSNFSVVGLLRFWEYAAL